MAKSSKKIKVAAHSGTFHPDDVLAVAIASMYLKKPIEIIRSRDMKVLAQCDYVFDVGGDYNPKKKIFNHHQKGWNMKRKNGILYASSGLAWKEFGEKITGSKEVAQKIDEKIMQPIDAEDNGQELYVVNFKGVNPYSFSDYIFSYNTGLYDKKITQLQAFKIAVLEARKMLEREIKKAESFFRSQKEILKIYKKTKDKRIIVLDNEYSGWKKTLAQFKEPLFVVKPVFENHNWQVTAMTIEGYKFKYRKYFPKSWAGLVGKELQKVSGVTDATFCHNGRIFAGADSKAGAIRLAQLAVQNKK